MEIKNKVVVITGGTRGLGKALMTSCVARDNKVVISARSTKRTSFDKEKQILTIKADVTKGSDMQKLATLTINKFGCIDIWINNAGIWLPHAAIERMNIKRVHEMVEVNLFGTIYGSKHALIQMRRQKNMVLL